MSNSFYSKSNNKKRQDAAWEFINGGNVGNRLQIVGANSQGCIDSSDCASGWRCSGGVCRQKGASAGSRSYGDDTGCGTGSSGDGSGGGGGICGAGTEQYTFRGEEEFVEFFTELLEDQNDPSSGQVRAGDVIKRELLKETGSTSGWGLWGVSLNGKCLKTGCGGPGKIGNNAPDICCGQGRCCRFGGGGFVQCFCGNCPPPPGNCSKWCDDYLSANGEFGAGCNDGNSCDECEACREDSNGSYRCKSLYSNAPCHCEGNRCKGTCDVCGDDGVCKEDCSSCRTCYTTFTPCDCGNIKVKCCYSACDQTKGYTECRDSVDCGKECGDPPGGVPDPCAGKCRTVTTCTPETPPPCPAKSSCRTSGTISAGGRTCTLTEICDKSGVPDSCGFCDCDCNNDCPHCQICNEFTGKCAPDPECNKYYRASLIFFYQEAFATFAYGQGCLSGTIYKNAALVGRWSGNLNDPNDAGLGYSWVHLGTHGPWDDCDAYIGCFPALGCFDSTYDSYYVRRSDGSAVTNKTSNRWEGKWSYSRMFYNSIRTRVSGNTYFIVGYGDTQAEATQDSDEKIAALYAAARGRGEL